MMLVDDDGGDGGAKTAFDIQVLFYIENYVCVCVCLLIGLCVRS